MQIFLCFPAIHREQLDTQVRVAAVFFFQIRTCLIVKTAKRVSIVPTNLFSLGRFNCVHQTQHRDKQLVTETAENQEQGVNFLAGPSTTATTAPARPTLKRSQQGGSQPTSALINKVGIWTANPKFASMEIYQNSLVACTGDGLSWKAPCEQINFSGSQSTAELNTQKLCGSHLRISHLCCFIRHRPCYTRAILLLCSHQDVCGCLNSLVPVSTGVPGTAAFPRDPDTG